MSASGYTPILLYKSGTTTNQPSVGNLAYGELAINYFDGKLFFKNASNVITLLASSSATSGTFSNVTITGGTINGTTIGATTTSSGAFTTLSASSTVSGTGFSAYLASPPSIGNTAPNTGAFTTLSTTGDALFGGTGQINLPAGTVGQRSGSPTTGMIRYNSTYAQFEGYYSATWSQIGGGATGGGGDQIFVENGVTVTTSYTLTTSKNAMSVGPITVNSGAVVTIPSGARWVVL